MEEAAGAAVAIPNSSSRPPRIGAAPVRVVARICPGGGSRGSFRVATRVTDAADSSSASASVSVCFVPINKGATPAAAGALTPRKDCEYKLDYCYKKDDSYTHIFDNEVKHLLEASVWFHVLAEFDETKRSCRKRLTEHNRRRRKPAGAQGKEDSSPPPKRADTCVVTACNSDHHKSSTAAAKSAAISPNGSGVSCLDAMDNVQPRSGAAAPTALSLAALPLHDDKDDDDGGLDSMLMRQVRGRRRDDDEDEHRRFMTSLVMQQQGQHDGSGGGGGGNILSCSSVSDQQNGGCNGFFEVDFI